MGRILTTTRDAPGGRCEHLRARRCRAPRWPFHGLDITLMRLASLQVAFEDVFEPLTVDLVPLPRVDALFQFQAISGHRVFASDATRADAYELTVMRRAAELAPIQRRIERDLFGFEVPR